VVLVKSGFCNAQFQNLGASEMGKKIYKSPKSSNCHILNVGVNCHTSD